MCQRPAWACESPGLSSPPPAPLGLRTHGPGTRDAWSVTFTLPTVRLQQLSRWWPGAHIVPLRQNRHGGVAVHHVCTHLATSRAKGRLHLLPHAVHAVVETRPAQLAVGKVVKLDIGVLGLQDRPRAPERVRRLRKRRRLCQRFLQLQRRALSSDRSVLGASTSTQRKLRVLRAAARRRAANSVPAVNNLKLYTATHNPRGRRRTSPSLTTSTLRGLRACAVCRYARKKAACCARVGYRAHWHSKPAHSLKKLPAREPRTPLSDPRVPLSTSARAQHRRRPRPALHNPLIPCHRARYARPGRGAPGGATAGARIRGLGHAPQSKPRWE